MAGHFAGLTTTMIGVGVNAGAVIAKGNDPFPAILAGGVLVTLVVLLGEATDPRLSAAFGATFLIGSLLINGQPLLNVINGISSAKEK